MNIAIYYRLGRKFCRNWKLVKTLRQVTLKGNRFGQQQSIDLQIVHHYFLKTWKLSKNFTYNDYICDCYDPYQ